MGVGAYTSYMLLQYIVGPQYLERPGDNELLFPLYLALFALGWGSSVLAWRTLAGDDATRRAFLRYWRALSPFIGVVLRAQLATIAREASRRVLVRDH